MPTRAAMDEETARAEIYGLLAQLYYAAPDAALMDALRAAPTQAPVSGGLLEEPWQQVVGSARALSASETAAEYDALFGGLAKPEVSLYASYYLTGFLNERPLAHLRGDLAALGLARHDAMPEPEDHVACVFEVMRYLIAGEDGAVCHLGSQSRFFAAQVLPWVPLLCEQLAAHPKARLYRALAGLTQAFVAIEAQGFDLLDQ
ncbi:MAG: molecular chaperone TorD family protein [Burkholderiaceae bacterium]|nr:molecular chaperone TorD family protein [Burkholderiaceae bacterium]